MKLSNVDGVKIDSIKNDGKILYYFLDNDEVRKDFVDINSIASKTDFDGVLKQHETLIKIIKELSNKQNELRNTVVKLSEELNNLKENFKQQENTEEDNLLERVKNLEKIVEDNIVF